MALILVLGLLAMTLALAYASLRSQSTAAQLARNTDRAGTARLAAESGIYAGLCKMSDGTWGGIASTLRGEVTDQAWYEVSFQTGDADLASADPAYAEYPFRVTIHATGFASDPSQPAITAMHQVRAVVQLARRSLQPEPANWNVLAPLSVHQWANRNVHVQFPARVEGTAHLLGRLNLAGDYPSSDTHLRRYLSDLNARRLSGSADDRPFNGPVVLSYGRQSDETLDLLQDDLGLATFNSTASTTAPVAHPGFVLSYRLYAGGQAYAPPIVQSVHGSSLRNIVLQPNPATNPLGIYRSNGPLAIQENVAIHGTLVGESSGGAVEIHARQVALAGVNLPPVEGDATVRQLPAAIVRDDLRLLGGSGVSISGLAMVYDDFEVRSGPLATDVALTGQLLSAGLSIRGRTQFDDLGDADWSALYASFRAQSTVQYFPDWLARQAALPPAPRIVIRRPTSGVKYHWHTWSQPVYRKDPADAGLRWNLVRWVEE